MLHTQSIIPLLYGFFLILGIGYWLRASGRLQSSASETINLIITDVTMPGLIVHVLYHQKMQIEMVSALFISWVALFACMGLGLLAARATKQSPQVQGTMGLCSGFSNTGFLGVPIIAAIYGSTPGAASTAILIDTFATTMFLYTIGIAWSMHFGHQGKFTWDDLLKVFKTPVAVTIVALIAINLFGVVIPGWIQTAAKTLGDMTVPLVLLSLGLRLEFSAIKGRVFNILMIAAIKFAACTAIALFLVMVFNLNGPVGEVTVLLAAMPCAMMSAVVSARYGCDAPIGTGAVVFTTVLSPLIIPFLINVLKHFGV